MAIGLRPRPPQYKGWLSPAQIAEGISVSNDNAVRLLDDAILLAKNGRHPSAVALGILAAEEAAKAHVLLAMAMCRDPKNGSVLKKHWKQFRSHTAKNIMTLSPLVDRKRGLQKSLEQLAAMTSDTRAVEDLKQTALYTDCIQYPDRIEWWIPHILDKKVSDLWLTCASLVVRTGAVTTEEIELWIRLMGRVAGGTPAAQEAAIETYLTEAKRLRYARSADQRDHK